MSQATIIVPAWIVLVLSSLWAVSLILDIYRLLLERKLRKLKPPNP